MGDQVPTEAESFQRGLENSTPSRWLSSSWLTAGSARSVRVTTKMIIRRGPRLNLRIKKQMEIQWLKNSIRCREPKPQSKPDIPVIGPGLTLGTWKDKIDHYLPNLSIYFKTGTEMILTNE